MSASTESVVGDPFAELGDDLPESTGGRTDHLVMLNGDLRHWSNEPLMGTVVSGGDMSSIRGLYPIGTIQRDVHGAAKRMAGESLAGPSRSDARDLEALARTALELLDRLRASQASLEERLLRIEQAQPLDDLRRPDRQGEPVEFRVVGRRKSQPRVLPED